MQGVGTTQTAVSVAVGGVAGLEGGETLVPLAVLGEGDAQLVEAIGGFFVVVEFVPIRRSSVSGVAVSSSSLPEVGGVVVEAEAVVESSSEGVADVGIGVSSRNCNFLGLLRACNSIV